MTEKKLRQQMDGIRKVLSDPQNGGYDIGESKSGVSHIPEMGSNELGRAKATDKVHQKIQLN